MGDGTSENPYTRKDVLRLIEENGGKAEGLDLSGKIFEEGIDLRGLNLQGIIFHKCRLYKASLRGSDLVRANLQNVILMDANLQGSNLAVGDLQDADLRGANLERTNLTAANLQRTDLRMTNIQEARLWHADLRGARLWNANFKGAFLEDIEWDKKYIVGEELKFTRRNVDKNAKVQWITEASSVYRHLKICHTEQGLYDRVGEFFYREMEVKRKAQSWKKKPHLKLWNWVLRLLCGYGEKPERVVISAAVIIFGLAAAYYFWGSFSASSFLDKLYYSVVSFVALGYGSWALSPQAGLKEWEQQKL